MNRVVKYSLIAGAAVAIFGCAGREVITETVEVKNPIPVPCLSKNDIPSEVPKASEFVTRESEDGEKIKAVLIERSRLRATDKEWRGVVAGCIE